jgi:hypothetical protein
MSLWLRLTLQLNRGLLVQVTKYVFGPRRTNSKRWYDAPTASAAALRRLAKLDTRTQEEMVWSVEVRARANTRTVLSSGSRFSSRLSVFSLRYSESQEIPSSISHGQQASGLEPRMSSKGKTGSVLFPYNNGSTIAPITTF